MRIGFQSTAIQTVNTIIQVTFDQISNWQVNLDFQHLFPLAMSHANIIIKRRVFSVPAWEAFIKTASKITVVIHPALLTLIKNVLNPRALWRVIISVPPLFFHTRSDRDVDFINAPREWDVLLGKIVRRYELGMEVQSQRSWDAGSRLGHDKGFKSIFPHLRSYCYGAEQRLYPHCSSWMYPHHLHQPCCPFRDQSKPMFM